MKDHEIIQLKFEDQDNFLYILGDRASRQAFFIDPAWDAEGLQEVMDEQNYRPVGVLITHSDLDHVNALPEIQRCYPDIPVFVSAAEQQHWPNAPVDCILLQDGDQIALGESEVQVLATPGHTAGSCCYYLDGDLLTGDTLFIYGAGNVRHPTASAAALFRSLQKLKTLPPETRIWCGHDYGSAESTDLAAQLAGNPFLMIEDEGDFLRFRLELAAKYRRTPYGPMTREELATLLRS